MPKRKPMMTLRGGNDSSEGNEGVKEQQEEADEEIDDEAIEDDNFVSYRKFENAFAAKSGTRHPRAKSLTLDSIFKARCKWKRKGIVGPSEDPKEDSD
ncbi:hypothetical protein PVK06_017520 [Gossypium arboreum]|uniref:Uncharacterized protein n=1 Tax=Gossypium arboreum TaxID=29729 RepID=A0ABR0Q3A4_GOSAR|nr:hypothetical protein PVK06_017520 [Gossypium arboreum]